jgi:BA14K-like protein
MKHMAWMMMAVCCVMAFAPYVPASAQQRHGSGDRDSGRGNVTINKYYGGRGGYGGSYGGQRHYYSGRQPGYRYEPGRGWYNPSAAIGGAIGSYLWRQWNQPAEPVRDVAWCMNRYRSYDPYTRTYLGYDGLRHGCP